ncbi:MAG: GGDEF domain-containing protein [Myxococcota bacterium]|nr:GGDEF domain-containing protein [Myxococcota bacterium]
MVSRTTIRRPREILVPGDAASCLVVIYGDALGRCLPLESDRTFVGRSAECQLRLDQDDVSRKHCEFVREGDAMVVRDLGSTNGTLVGEQRLGRGGSHRLASGDWVRIGGVILKYLAGGDLEALYHEEIYRTMITDGLTGLFNRRHLFEFLQRELARSVRHKRPLSLILLDVDHFKAINDAHGHLAGDQVLCQVGHVLAGSTRRDACAARFGGEEFAVVLPEAELQDALACAERLRGSVEARAIRVDGVDIPVTVSAGVAQLGEHADVDALVGAADAHLYAAKQGGRNRVSG